MRIKIIPFDLETAKKIQAGEIEGSIKTKNGQKVRILCTDMQNDGYPMVVAIMDSGRETVNFYRLDGSYYIIGVNSGNDLVLEVPDNDSQFNLSYSIEQLNKLKEYTEQLMEVNQGVIDELSCMIQELRKTCNLSPKTEFKPFDKVLVRDSNKGSWQISFFSHIQDDWFITCNGHMYKECIPYEGNEHLIGTTNKPKED